DGGAPPTSFHTCVVLALGANVAYRVSVILRRRGATWYGVTDRRVIFALVQAVPSVISVEYADVKEIELKTHPDGFGSITFPLREVDPYLAGSEVLAGHGAPGWAVFEQIASPQEVYEIAREARRQADAAASSPAV